MVKKPAPKISLGDRIKTFRGNFQARREASAKGLTRSGRMTGRAKQGIQGSRKTVAGLQKRMQGFRNKQREGESTGQALGRQLGKDTRAAYHKANPLSRKHTIRS